MRYGKTMGLALLCALALLLSGCGKGGAFDGSIVADKSQFHMEYAILNREQAADLPLKEGDALHVVFAHESGNVDVKVGLNGREPIYTGNGQADADFTLIVPESGDYHISVTGHQAKGRVSFDRIPQNTK